jgi:hypothetical protein
VSHCPENRNSDEGVLDRPKNRSEMLAENAPSLLRAWIVVGTVIGYM